MKKPLDTFTDLNFHLNVAYAVFLFVCFVLFCFVLFCFYDPLRCYVTSIAQEISRQKETKNDLYNSNEVSVTV